MKGGVIVKKLAIFSSVALSMLVMATPVFAQTATTGGVSQIETFIKSVIQVFITLAGIVAVGFFVFGGFRYITSTGNPESLDKAKHTILYSGIGLTIVLAAFVLMNIITQLATSAFGAAQ